MPAAPFQRDEPPVVMGVVDDNDYCIEGDEHSSDLQERCVPPGGLHREAMGRNRPSLYRAQQQLTLLNNSRSRSCSRLCSSTWSGAARPAGASFASTSSHPCLLPELCANGQLTCRLTRRSVKSSLP